MVSPDVGFGVVSDVPKVLVAGATEQTSDETRGVVVVNGKAFRSAIRSPTDEADSTLLFIEFNILSCF